jgi:hypothetical protein
MYVVSKTQAILKKLSLWSLVQSSSWKTLTLIASIYIKPSSVVKNVGSWFDYVAAICCSILTCKTCSSAFFHLIKVELGYMHLFQVQLRLIIVKYYSLIPAVHIELNSSVFKILLLIGYWFFTILSPVLDPGTLVANYLQNLM